MNRLITILVLILISVQIQAQNTLVEKEIKKTIATFFEGLHQGDSTLLKTTIHKDLKTHTTYTNREGEHILKTGSRENLLKTVAGKKSSDVYLEKLLSYAIKVDGNLASVWTPYEFYLNGEFSHCGTNSFQLFNNKGTWKIIYIVDMRRRQNCTALKNNK